MYRRLRFDPDYGLSVPRIKPSLLAKMGTQMQNAFASLQALLQQRFTHPRGY